MATPSVVALLEHTGFVRNLARGALGREDGSEDVAQDAWVAALESGPREAATARGWLARVVKNRVVSLGRRETIQRRSLREVSPRPDVPSPSEILEREEARRRLVEALTRLDAIYREPLVLRYYEDLPPRKIARRLDLPVETVRTRLRRGLERLRESLTAQWGGRREWVVGLLPLARLPRGGSAGATGGAAVGARVAAGAVLVLGATATVVALRAGDREAMPRPQETAAATAPSPVGEPGVLHGRASAATADAAGAPPADPSTAEGPRQGIVVVLDEARNPLPGARVRIVERRRRLGADGSFDRGVVDRLTDPDGRVFFPHTTTPDAQDGVPAPKFLLFVAPPGSREDLEEVEVEGWRPADTTLSLGRGIVLAGQVVDGRGQGVAGATIHLASASRSLSVEADGLGRFRRASLSALPWRAWATAPGVRGLLRGEELTLDGPTDRARLEIDVGASLRVTLVGFDRRDRGVPLRVTDYDPERPGDASTSSAALSADGDLVLHGLAPSRRVAVWWGPDPTGRTAYASGLAPSDSGATVPVRAGRRLSVEVRRPPDWQGSTSVWVSAPGLATGGVWAPNGDAVFDGLPDVELTVRAAGTDADRREASGHVAARPGDAVVLEMKVTAPPPVDSPVDRPHRR